VPSGEERGGGWKRKGVREGRSAIRKIIQSLPSFPRIGKSPKARGLDPQGRLGKEKLLGKEAVARKALEMLFNTAPTEGAPVRLVWKKGGGGGSTRWTKTNPGRGGTRGGNGLGLYLCGPIESFPACFEGCASSHERGGERRTLYIGKERWRPSEKSKETDHSIKGGILDRDSVGKLSGKNFQHQRRGRGELGKGAPAAGARRGSQA